MLKKVCLAAAILAVAATPAFADGDCGTEPIAPAIPAASDIAGQTIEAARIEVKNAFQQVKNYQGSLKPFRACLETQNEAEKVALAEAQSKRDSAKVAAIIQRIDDRLKIENHTIDTETQVANDFNALHIAHCTRDTDPKICPKKQ